MFGLSKRITGLIGGPLLFAAIVLLLQGRFGFDGAAAIGVMFWMGYWWIAQPVHIAVTAMIPVVINAIFDLTSASAIISQYSSEIVVLLFGATLICLTWESTGLDRRLSLKLLCLIGSSLRQQLVVWLFMSALMSAVLPNSVVATIFTPIAIAMFSFTNLGDIKDNPVASVILLAIVWGTEIGGMASPLGGSMNLVVVNYIEEFTGEEFMYIDWVVRLCPVVLVMLLLNLVYLFAVKVPVKQLPGTRDYFKEKYQDLGKMGKGEKISLVIFLLAIVASFLRPLYASIAPSIKPAFAFLICGFATFFFRDERGKHIISWKQVENKMMWGLLFLYAGGLALGRLIIDTGAADVIAELISSWNLSGELLTITIMVIFARLLAEVSSNTTAASISVPIVLSITQGLGLNPIPYIFITAAAFNSAYILPLSVRAIPVGYGMEAKILARNGMAISILSVVVISLIGYAFTRWWPYFGAL